jgi:MFS family permease
MFGSTLSGFGLGVWIYQHTGSVLQFGTIFLLSVLPTTLLGPVAGALVDRWSRRFTLITSDAVAAASTLALLVLVSLGRLETWHMYAATLVNSIANVFQLPAFVALTPLLVPRQHLARASGTVQTAASASAITAPLLAGAGLVRFGLEGLLWIDLATFGLAMLSLISVPIPSPPRSAAGRAAQGSLAHEIAFGWRYIRERSGLLSLLLLLAMLNFTSGIVNLSVTPLVLGFAGPPTLGAVLSAGSIGTLAGGIFISIWGGSERRVRQILTFLSSAALLIMLCGLRASAPLVAVGLFGYLFSIPVAQACSQALWLAKVEPDLQGRIIAIRRAVATSSMPLAYALGGPLADYFFEPLLAPRGALAGTVGRLIGVGPGRGVALMLVLTGLLMLAALSVAWRSPRLRRLDDAPPEVLSGPAGEAG